jgi:5'-phosphate synthase pdxT subunit
MVAPLQERIGNGMPVWGVCAGAILLARRIDGATGPLEAVPAEVTRNAYGRQINSSRRPIDIPLFDVGGYPAIFIRAPKFTYLDAGVTVHAKLEDDPVFIQTGRIMATTFHPELIRDDIFHRYFLSI